MSGIYIHIPYCRQACHYCSFHFSTSLQHKDSLVHALIKEINMRREELEERTLSSIYLGGGTPSLLSLAELELIFNELKQHFKITSATEITLEANPEDITRDALQAWSDIGINRLSIGIQSFLDKDLKFMNRAHDSSQSHKALELIASSQFNNVTGDLMFGLIDSTLEEWQYNLKTISDYNLSHLSVYNLTVEEQTVFANWKAKQKIAEPSTELQFKQFRLAHDFLESQGYEHYEISNYCKSGSQAIHNTNYWDRVSYLGIGPSAHSYMNNTRKWNVSNNAAYVKMLNNDEYTTSSEELDLYDHYNELIMLGLRTKKGVQLNDIAQLPQDIQDHFNKCATDLIAKGNLKKDDHNLTLSTDQWYISDDIAAELFIEK